MQTDATIDRLRHDPGPLLDALRKAGADVSRPKCIRCPWHEDAHASSGVFAGKEDGVWRFKCQVCGVGGDVFDIRAKVSGRDVADELRAARGEQQHDRAPAQQHTAPPKRVYASIEAIEQDIPTIRRTFVYADPTTGAPEMIVFRQRLADGRKSFMQARPVDGGFVLEAPPKPWPIYNRARVCGAERVVVVEGEGVVHALHDLGIVATTSPGGAGKAAHADWSPLAGKTCILWPDCDPPNNKGVRTGIAHMREVARLLQALEPPTRVLWIDPDLLNLPPKGDAADFIAQRADLSAEQQRAAVEDALSEAVAIGPSSEVAALVDDAIAGRRRIVGWPWPALHALTRALSPATVTLLVAHPGATKSFALLQAAQWWHEHGERVAVLELEDGRAFHLRRAIAQHAGEGEFTSDEWCRDHPETARDIAARSAAWADSFGACIHELPGDVQPTMQTVGDWIEQQADAGKRIIAVDPLSIVEARRDQFIHDQRFIARVKRIVEQAGCSLVLVMHPRKNSDGMTTDDIAGGAAFGRLAQTVIWLEFCKSPRTVTVRDTTCELPVNVEVNRIAHLVKTRIGRGQGSRIGYHFDGATLRLREHGAIMRATPAEVPE